MAPSRSVTQHAVSDFHSTWNKWRKGKKLFVQKHAVFFITEVNEMSHVH
jgi:hypothetical protein